MGSSRRLSGEPRFSVKLTQTTPIGCEGNLGSVREKNAGATPYKLPEMILTAREAASPRYFRVISRVTTTALRLNRNGSGRLVPFKSGEGGAIGQVPGL